MKSWTKKLWVSALASAGMLYGASAHSQQSDPGASVEAASILTLDQAAALLAVNVTSETLPADLALELAKFMRDLEANEDVQKAQALKTELAGKVTTAVAGLGLNGLPGLNGAVLGMPFAPGTSLQTIYNTLGLTNTLAFLTGSVLLPDLSSFLLPHNIRSIGTYTRTVTATQTTGSLIVPRVTRTITVLGRPVVVVVTPGTPATVGQKYRIRTTLDVDVLTLAGIDGVFTSDTVAIQVPLAIQIDVIDQTCTATTVVSGIERCTAVNTVLGATTMPAKQLATNPSYRFAYPVNAGFFPTRATASDALMIAYDALGSVPTQVPAAAQFRSPFVLAPGFENLVDGTSLPELSTQAPPVSFYGLQTTSDANLVIALNDGAAASALRLAGLEPLDLRRHPPVESQRVLGTDLSMPRHRLGMTAGYKAREVRAGTPHIMVSRWHNLGSSTVTDALGNVVGALSPNLTLPQPLVLPFASAPATFYYDVPAGQYTLNSNRTDTQGGVYVVDYVVASAAPPVVIPPRVNLGGLTTLTGLLGGVGLPGGDLPIDVPNLP